MKMNKTTNPYHEFLRKVYRMRKAQKTAKLYPSQVAQRSATSLEMEVDKWLEAAGAEGQKMQQMRLDAEPPKTESDDV
jgi:hypothetical protein